MSKKPGSPQRVHEIVGEIAARYPEDTAVRWPGGSLSYGGLSRSASGLARLLTGARTVALLTRRSPQLAAGVLGVLEAGAAYLPLDAAYPAGRLAFMLADSGADVLCHEGGLADRLPVPSGCEVISLGEVADGTFASEEPAGQRQARPDGPQPGTAYVIYTSGSTGLPKGVGMSHVALANLIDWQASASAASRGWRTLQLAPISFDVSVQEIFATWTTGGTLVLADEGLRTDPRRLLDYLERQVVNRLFLPFVVLSQLADEAGRRDRYPSALREVFAGGERLRITLPIRDFFDRTGASLDNHYGPTETHVATAERLTGPPGSWPLLPSIGPAVRGAEVFAADAQGQRLPAGDPGEIWVSGPVLADGYVNRDDLTTERFVARPGRPRAYRTGDLGRELSDGRFEFMGRLDDQVKIRGFRIEPGEIEAQMTEVPGITTALVVARESAAIGLHLVGCYLSGLDQVTAIAAIRERLESSLPSHMVPERFVQLDEMPLTASGKIDRAGVLRLLTDDATASAVAGAVDNNSERVNAESEAELLIAGIWTEILGVEVLWRDVSFFRLGGHSLLVALLSSRLEDAFGTIVPVSELFAHDTLAAQVVLLDQLFASAVRDASNEDLATVIGELLE